MPTWWYLRSPIKPKAGPAESKTGQDDLKRGAGEIKNAAALRLQTAELTRPSTDQAQKREMDGLIFLSYIKLIK